MVAAGIAMTPEPGGNESGWSLIFFGGLTLIPGWPLYFLPSDCRHRCLHRRSASEEARPRIERVAALGTGRCVQAPFADCAA